MDLAFIVAVLALLVSLASASFEIYRWRREDSASKPNISLVREFSTWSDKFPHAYFSYVLEGDDRTDLRELGPPSAFVVRATNSGGAGVEVVNIQFQVGNLLVQPQGPFERSQDLGGFGVYKVDRLPVFIEPLRTARWWWDLGSTVHGPLGESSDLRESLENTPVAPRVVARLSTGEEITLRLPDGFAMNGSSEQE